MRVVDRFWSKVQFALDGSGCYLWIGSRTQSGHGLIRIDGRNVPAHRWAWEEWNGPIPAGLHIDHLCRNPPCVNPDHLEPVTPHENMLRGTAPAAVNARKTHCIRGHKLVQGKGRRYCQVCANAYKNAYKKRTFTTEERRQQHDEWYTKVGPGYYRDWRRRRKAITIVTTPDTPPEEVLRLKALALQVYRDLERDLADLGLPVAS